MTVTEMKKLQRTIRTANSFIEAAGGTNNGRAILEHIKLRKATNKFIKAAGDIDKAIGVLDIYEDELPKLHRVS